MRQDTWDLSVVCRDGDRDYIGVFDSKAEAEQAGREVKAQCRHVEYIDVTRATSWSNNGFIEGLD